MPRRRLQREHLHMALADLEMVAVPGDRALHDLPVYAGIAAELVMFAPLFQVEEIAEELERLRSCRAGEVRVELPRCDFQNRCRLFKSTASAMVSAAFSAGLRSKAFTFDGSRVRHQ